MSNQLICSVIKNLLNFIVLLKQHPNMLLSALRTEELTVFLLGGFSN